jgi:hypothetical protein
MLLDFARLHNGKQENVRGGELCRGAGQDRNPHTQYCCCDQRIADLGVPDNVERGLTMEPFKRRLKF